MGGAGSGQRGRGAAAEEDMSAERLTQIDGYLHSDLGAAATGAAGGGARQRRPRPLSLSHSLSSLSGANRSPPVPPLRDKLNLSSASDPLRDLGSEGELDAARRMRRPMPPRSDSDGSLGSSHSSVAALVRHIPLQPAGVPLPQALRQRHDAKPDMFCPSPQFGGRLTPASPEPWRSRTSSLTRVATPQQRMRVRRKTTSALLASPILGALPSAPSSATVEEDPIPHLPAGRRKPPWQLSDSSLGSSQGSMPPQSLPA
eukprot:TRINITY_DN16129_c0_g1_i1.p1 TRINITY_DN16129_c0_g1~~TRINITY_DN16129_c0_g1_i1.p1  ORF type:complete len:258 (+),score=42.23 TRINITY_DN16129_c0_g1_i1:66-839(+)